MKPKAPDQRNVTVGTKSADALWAAVFEREKLRTEAELEADGWLSLSKIAERMGMSRPGAESWLTRKGFEKCEGKATNSQRATFYRPTAA